MVKEEVGTATTEEGEKRRGNICNLAAQRPP